MSLFESTKYAKTENSTSDRRKSLGKNHNKKFIQLYDNYKAIKTKEERYRQKILSEREKSELAECSFSPKITKKKQIFNKKPFEAISQKDRENNKLKMKESLKSDAKTIDLINRQNKWLEDRNNKLNHKIVEEAIKSVEGCVFKPEIKRLNKRVISNFKKESNKIVEKPESYNNFINKNKKFRENKNNNINKIYEYPAAKKWRSPNKNKKNKLNDYDYTKHELIEDSYLLKNKSSSYFKMNFSTSASNRAYKEKKVVKTKKSIPISKLKITNISNEELYSLIYNNEKEKIEKNLNDFTEENLKKIFGDKKQISFRQAMDGLHNALINLNLSDDSDEEIIMNEGEIDFENEN